MIRFARVLTISLNSLFNRISKINYTERNYEYVVHKTSFPRPPILQETPHNPLNPTKSKSTDHRSEYGPVDSRSPSATLFDLQGCSSSLFYPPPFRWRKRKLYSDVYTFIHNFVVIHRQRGHPIEVGVGVGGRARS